MFNFDGTRAVRKHIPDLVFNVDSQLQLAFLRGYFMGDGTLSVESDQFATTSETLANQLMYLLLGHGIKVSLSRACTQRRSQWHDPGQTDHHTPHCLLPDRRVSGVSVNPGAGLAWTCQREPIAGLVGNTIGTGWTACCRPMIGNLIGLPVRSVREVNASSGKVYDFSVRKTKHSFVVSAE